MKLNFTSLKVYIVLVSLVALSGCAHNIQLNPDLAELRNIESNSIINKNVAYYISAENKQKQVTTPGGGGDKVTYRPYADTEGALNTVLSNIFSRVYSMNSVDDTKYISEKNISFIFIPEIITSSSSSSAFTWPPTEFTINLSCKAIDTKGLTIWEKTMQSKGNAEFSEFKSDFSLAARRASEALFKDLHKELINEKKKFK